MNSSIFSSPKQGSQFQNSLSEKTISPSRAKISQLSEKLSNMQTTIDDDKALKKEHFEYRLRSLDEKVTKQTQNDEQKFKLIKDQLNEISELMQEEVYLRDNSDEQFKTKDLKQIDYYLQRELAVEKQSRRDSAIVIQKLVEERVYKLRLELAHQRKAREDYEQQQSQQLGDEIIGLQEEVEQERAAREQQNQVLIHNFGEQILDLQENLTSERRQREDAQRQMFGMLDEMNGYLVQQLQEEKYQRDVHNDALIGLIDETCNRIGMQLRK